jgi:SPOR domain
MDQNTSGGSDKRNWRERLGIGTKEVSGSKDPADAAMPRVANEFKQVKPAAAPVPLAPRPAAPVSRPVAPVAKAAPMAPRLAPRPAVVAPVSRAPNLQPDALAEKLKSQREAAEKMAEQRVIAARQRAEAALAPIAAAPAKPKFAFADDDAKTSRPTAPQANPQQRPVQSIPPVRPNALPPASPQLAPPRPQLGGNVAVPQRAPAPQQSAYPQGQPYNQQQGYPNSYIPVAAQQPQQNYAPPPSYRPIDPATGYAPPPAYVPTPGYAPAPRQQYDSGPQGQPRLQMPPRAPQLNATGYEPSLQPGSRPVPQQRYADQEQDDIFERPAQQRGQRRATANDYQQAYREVEAGYDDEGSRSNVPWILVGLLALVLAGFGSIWAYTNYVKPSMIGGSATTQQDVPVVKAPEQATKVTPTVEPEAIAPPAGQVVPPTKKQIYDRIVGDREVLGGDIVPTEETPVQPVTNAQPIPAAGATGTGADGTPLPLPPPPGENTQGTLEPSTKGDQQIANITPAASESLAADSQIAAVPQAPTAPAAPAAEVQITPAAPVPGETSPLKPAQDAPAITAAEPNAAEAISDVPAETTKRPAAAKPVAPKKIVIAPKADKSLGSKPVILVPAVKQPKARSTQRVETVAVDNANSLYGDGTEVADTTVVAQSPQTAVTAAPKRKSLLDLFKRNKETVGQDLADTAVDPFEAPQIPAEQKVATLNTKPIIETATPKPTGAYVAQLASFKSKSEANQEYARMKSKHGAIISRYAPIISQAQVAGTTRYRLNLGPMASANVASGFCQSLFAAGERDCLVQRQ